MKRTIIIMILASVLLATVGCAGKGVPKTLYAGSFTPAEIRKTVEFTDSPIPHYTDTEKKDIYMDVCGIEGTWKYENSFPAQGIYTENVNYYTYEYEDGNLASVVIDDNGKLVAFGDRLYLGDGLERNVDAENISEEAAKNIACEFAEQTLQISVKEYKISCSPSYGKWMIDHYTFKFDNSYDGDYCINDYFEINVDGYTGAVRGFSTTWHKSVDREKVPEINVSDFDKLIKDQAISEIKKQNKNPFLDAAEFIMKVTSRNIIQSTDGTLMYRCHIDVSKRTSDKNDEIWESVYSSYCYIFLD